MTTTGGAELTKISLDLVLKSADTDAFLTPNSVLELFVDTDSGEDETDPGLPPSTAETDEMSSFRVILLPSDPNPRKLFLLEFLLTVRSSPLDVGVLVARRWEAVGLRKEEEDEVGSGAGGGGLGLGLGAMEMSSHVGEERDAGEDGTRDWKS